MKEYIEGTLKASGDKWTYSKKCIKILVKHKEWTYNRVIEFTLKDFKEMLQCFGFDAPVPLLDKEAVFVVDHGENLEIDESMMLKLLKFFMEEKNDDFDFKDEEGNNI